jgi:signal transduction histidine kinase
MAEIALKWPNDPELALHFYQDTLDATLQLQQIVNNLLALARNDLGVTILNCQRVDLNEMITMCLSRFSEEINEKQLTFNRNINHPVLINTSQTEFDLILNNIVSNAIEYSPKHTTITIVINMQNTHFVQLQIGNEMIDMLSEQDLSDMFNRMWRKDLSRSSERHAGLGMSLIKSYSELLMLSVNVNVIGQTRFNISIGNIKIDE